MVKEGCSTSGGGEPENRCSGDKAAAEANACEADGRSHTIGVPSGAAFKLAPLSGATKLACS